MKVTTRFLIFVISTLMLYFNTPFQSNVNPNVLFIMFSSYGIFIHASAPTVDTRIPKHLTCYYLNLLKPSGNFT
jgi:hypothetical protein